MDFFRDDVLLPYLAGTVDLAAARSQLIRRSTVYYADRLPPVQIHQGLADGVVPPSQSARLAERLQALGRPVEYYTYPGAGHAFPLGPEQLLRMFTFAETHLQTAPQ